MRHFCQTQFSGKTKGLYKIISILENMPDEEERIHEKYLKRAKKLLEYDDVEARVEEAVKLAKEYHNDDTLHADLIKDFIHKIDHGKLGELEKKINEKVIKNKKKLSDLEAEEYLKDILKEIMVPTGYGNEDDREILYSQFKAYLSTLGNDGHKIFGQTLEAIKKGMADDAIYQIRKGLSSYHINNHREHFHRTLLPQDHEKFRESLSKYVTNKGNESLEGELDEQQIKLNLDEMLLHYAKGNYEEMHKKAGKKTDYTHSSE